MVYVFTLLHNTKTANHERFQQMTKVKLQRKKKKRYAQENLAWRSTCAFHFAGKFVLRDASCSWAFLMSAIIGLLHLVPESKHIYIYLLMLSVDCIYAPRSCPVSFPAFHVPSVSLNRYVIFALKHFMSLRGADVPVNNILKTKSRSCQHR